MARRSRMSILKRQRELQKSEKAARKRARRHGQHLPEESSEPRPTDAARVLFGGETLEEEQSDAAGPADEGVEGER